MTFRNKYPTDVFIVYPNEKGRIGINAHDWLEDEKLYAYVGQLSAFTVFCEPVRGEGLEK